MSQIKLFLLFVALVFLCQPQPGESQSTTLNKRFQDATPLIDYLEHIGAPELKIRLLEKTYQSTLNGSERKKIAKILLHELQDYFFASPNSELAAAMVERTKSVLVDFPEFKTNRVALALLHANFVLVEQKFNRWWKNGADPSLQTKLIQGLAALKVELSRLTRRLEDEASNQLTRLPIAPADKNTVQIEADRVETNLIHASYLLGWTNYLHSTTLPQTDYRLLEEARLAFYRTLQLEIDKPIDEIHEKWMPAESNLTHLAYSGLVFVYAAMSDQMRCDFCLRRSKKNSALSNASQIGQVAKKYQAYAQCRDWRTCLRILDSSVLEEFDFQELRPLWISVFESGMIASNHNDDSSVPLQLKLRRRAILELLRNMDANSLERLISRFKIELNDQTAVDLWIKGTILLSGKSKEKDSVAKATKSLDDALKIDNGLLTPEDKIRIKYQLALAAAKQKEFEKALALLDADDLLTTQVSNNLKERIDHLRFLTLFRISSKSTQFLSRAIESATSFLIVHPRSRHRDSVSFKQLKLACRLLEPEIAIQKLSGLDVSHQDYWDAQLAILEHLNRRIVNTAEIQESIKLYHEIRVVEEKIRDQEALNFSTKISALILRIQAAFKCRQTRNEFNRLFFLVESMADGREIPMVSSEKLQFFKLKFLVEDKQNEEADLVANWLISHAKTDSYRITAAIHLIKKFEEQGARDVAKLIELYAELVTSESSQAQTPNQNQRAATNRLVELLLKDGQIELAEEYNRSLLKVFPNDLTTLLLNSRIQTRLGKVDEALQQWRLLAAGSNPSEKVWVEAKTEIARLIAERDSATAQKILTQIRLLAGQLSKEQLSKLESIESSFIEDVSLEDICR